jgi:calcium permeable stress-gated cation channel
LNKEIEAARASTVSGKFLGSAFLRCNLQMGAHVLAQCVSHHKVLRIFINERLRRVDELSQPLAMYDKWLETSPKDIVWENLDEQALEMGTRYLISWTATIGLIILWAFPAAFIGSLSNLESLCQKVG